MSDDSEPGTIEKRLAIVSFTGWIVVVAGALLTGSAFVGLVLAVVWMVTVVSWLRRWFGRLRRLRRASPGYWTDWPRLPRSPRH